MKKKAKRWLVVLGIALICYVGSHFLLSRLAMARHAKCHITGYYYVPCSFEKLVISDSVRLLNTALYWFYSPVWYIELHVFGGPGPAHLPDTFSPFYSGRHEVGPAVRPGR